MLRDLVRGRPRRRFALGLARLAAILVLGSGGVGCRGWRGEGDTYYAHRLPLSRARREATYQIGQPGAGWRALRGIEGLQVAWTHADLRGVIEVHAQCDEHGDSSLEQYTDHMRIDWTDWTVESQEHGTLVERASLRTVVSGRLDGQARRMEMIVVKRAGCLFDLRLATPPAGLEAARPAFERVVAGFRFPVP